MEDGEGTDEQEVVDITVGELKDIIRDVFMTLQGGEEAALDADTDLAADLDMDMADDEMAADDTEISLEEILRELEAADKKVEEGTGPGGEIDPKAADVHNVSNDSAKELNEAIKTIKALKHELNEINLFNAKLMYVNKIFKARNLSESQKTKVISAFDRSTSVKEVENTFRTLSESISAAPKKSSLKESVGFASKAMGNAPARPIVEADAFVTRWQQLAGIK
jgi:predicted  nucleic acid-binding Zn-ribbon protein